MLPTTNFDEIYTFMTCPSRLLLKLSGFKSEVQRSYTPPLVSPALLGQQGEDEISNGYLQTPEVWAPQLEREEIQHSRCTLDQFVKRMTRIVRREVTAVTDQCHAVSVRYLPKMVTELARSLKKQFGVIAILEGVGYTTVPHHYVGRVDFLGIKEDDEAVIIEAKNKAAKLNRRDTLQLEYYMAGLPRHYQFTKIHEHIHTLAAQLNPRNYLKYISLMKRLDLMQQEEWELEEIVTGSLDMLNPGDLRKFIKIYSPKETISPDGFDYDIEVAATFLNTVPEFQGLVKTSKEYAEKTLLAEKEFNQLADDVLALVSRGFRNGLLVDVGRQQIQDVSLETDFDAATRGIWSVKRNAVKGQLRCVKNHQACSRCQYSRTCSNKVKEEGELEPTKSVTSIAHKFFSRTPYDYDSPVLRSFFEDDHIEMRRTPAVFGFYRKGRREKLSDKGLLRLALARSEWGYKDWFLRKRGWKSLFADALASKKLDLELEFWGL